MKKSFANKSILFDFWATWCGPCLMDLPYSQQLHEQIPEAPIEFVYLCTAKGSDMEKWKRKISELGLSGTHIFVDAQLESKLMDLFFRFGFPELCNGQ